MAIDAWFDRLSETLSRTATASYGLPLQPSPTEAANVTVRQFGPYDTGGGNWQFNTALRFEVPTGSNARLLYAMTTGAMRFQTGTSGQPGKVILQRGDAPGTAVAQAVGGLPYWYPQPLIIIYQNIDPVDARRAAQIALEREGELAIARKRANVANTTSKARMIELWLEGKADLCVLGGDLIGGCGSGGTGGRLFAEVRMVKQVDPQPTLFYNPGYYLALWNAMDWLGGGATLIEQLTETSGPPVGTGILHFVRRTGGSVPNTFSTIGAAIAAAGDGDTVLILDQDNFTEAVILEKPISLMSTGRRLATDANPDYPTLDGQDDHRPLTIRNVNTGVAHVSKFKIINGRGTGPREDGGGILVERSHNVVISSCAVSQCKAPGGGPTAVFGEGFGGGIAAHHSSPAIVGCTVKDNHANARGSGIGVWGYGWPAIFRSQISNNSPRRMALNHRPDGGGIAMTISVANAEDVGSFRGTTRANLDTRFDRNDLQRSSKSYARITECTIQNNEARDDGGGVYISVASRVVIRRTSISRNRTQNDGGGIRVTLDSELQLIDCLINRNEANLGGRDAGGGGISARNSRLIKLERTNLLDNTVHGFAGGGLYFISSDEGTYDIPGLDFDWNDILLNSQVFKHTQSTLIVDATNNFRTNHAINESHGKGGGMYILRFRGPRKSRLGDVDGQPVHIFLGSVNVLDPSNEASFPNSNRLFLQDMVDATPPKDNRALPGTGAFTHDSTQPSRPLYP